MQNNTTAGRTFFSVTKEKVKKKTISDGCGTVDGWDWISPGMVRYRAPGGANDNNNNNKFYNNTTN